MQVSLEREESESQVPVNWSTASKLLHLLSYVFLLLGFIMCKRPDVCKTMYSVPNENTFIPRSLYAHKVSHYFIY
jgi:hypothetical protein